MTLCAACVCLGAAALLASTADLLARGLTAYEARWMVREGKPLPPRAVGAVRALLHAAFLEEGAVAHGTPP